MTRVSTGIGCVWAIGLFCVFSGNAAAQPPSGSPPQSATAEARLRAVADAYQKLTAYADRGELVLAYRQGNTPQSIRDEVPLRYVRSERVLWDATVTSIAADRAGVTVVNADLTSPFTAFVARDFLGRPQPPPPTRVTVTPQPPDEILTQLLQLAGPTLLETLATLMSSPDAASLIRTRFSSLQDEPDRMLDGRPAWVVVMQPRVQAAPVAIWIDPATKLVRRVDMILPRDPTARDDDLGDATLSWSSGSIVTDPDKVMAELEVATRDRLAQTVERSAPVLAWRNPPVPSKSLPPVPSKTLPIPSPVPPAPQAPAKAAPVSVVPNSRDDRGGGLPVIAVSLLIVQPSGQTAAPNYVTRRGSLFRIFYCRLYPQDCGNPVPGSSS